MDTAFFVSSKIIWGLIRPETLLILLLCASYRAARSHDLNTTRRHLGLALVFILGIAILPLGDLVLYPLESLYPAQPKLNRLAGIIVLGGGADIDRSATWGVPIANDAGDRFLATISLARLYPKAPIFFTGGSGNLSGAATSEAPIARTIFLRAGISADRLHFESVSRTTAENATLLRKTIRSQSAGQWILVTSAYHMPRAMSSFCAAGWTGLVAWPTDYRSAKFVDDIGWDFARHLHALNIGVKEWIGLAAYGLSGRSLSLLAKPCGAGISVAELKGATMPPKAH